jgi:hypothetical protein
VLKPDLSSDAPEKAAVKLVAPEGVYKLQLEESSNVSLILRNANEIMSEKDFKITLTKEIPNRFKVYSVLKPHTVSDSLSLEQLSAFGLTTSQIEDLCQLNKSLAIEYLLELPILTIEGRHMMLDNFFLTSQISQILLYLGAAELKTLPRISITTIRAEDAKPEAGLLSHLMQNGQIFDAVLREIYDCENLEVAIEER